MQQDDMIWHCMKTGFCSFKVQTKTQILCKNDNNVLGLCSRSACPLANSNYATVREHRGIIYLCKKVVERAAFPHKLWEKIRLTGNYEEALQQIDTLLPYWNPKQVHRCKQRYTKIYQYLERTRKMATKMRAKKLITLPRKMERREKAREKKAMIAAKIENSIEMEIMNRVKMGVYGERYQFKDKNVFEKAMVDRGDEVELAEEEPVASTSKGVKRKAVEQPVKLSKKYVADIEDLDGEFDKDISDGDDFWASEDEEWEREAAKKQSGKKRREMLTIEREE
uniref:Protein MAK16 homolog n=1 Tax=Aceria tosichella TaxID=561515 RepID=A0A6G1SMZ1_9ACAR